MIAIFDEDGGGDVDFQEFVTGLSAFSSKGNKEQKLHFAFKVYDIDRDGYISNGELFIVLKMMVGSNLKDQQLQQIVDKTIMEADLDKDGKISFEEFTKMVESTDISMSMTVGMLSGIVPMSEGAPSCVYLMRSGTVHELMLTKQQTSSKRAFMTGCAEGCGINVERCYGLDVHRPYKDCVDVGSDGLESPSEFTNTITNTIMN